MRALILALALASPAAAGEVWTDPLWHLGATSRHGAFVTTTSMYVKRTGRPSGDRVDIVCSVTDTRRPVSHAVVRGRGRALYRQGLWCGDGGALGSWCVTLEHGATLMWYGKTPCAGGAAEFSTGD